MQIANLILRRWTRGAVLALLTFISTLAHGAENPNPIPAAINYQGRLTDNLGHPVGSGYYEIQFRIWDHPTQDGVGSVIWARTFPLHVVTNGIFNVLLSDAGGLVGGTTNTVTLLDAFNGTDRYLGLTITLSNGVSVSNPEVSPRQQLASAPYAVRAQWATQTLPGSVDTNSLQRGSVTTAKIAPGAVTTTNIADGAVTSAKLASNVALLDRSSQNFSGANNFAGSVGIGTTNPKAKLDVRSTGGALAFGSPGGAQGERAVMELWSTFTNVPNDNTARRTADVTAGFQGGGWGKEFLSLNVGNNGSANDAGTETSEKVRIQANGNVGIGTTTPASTLHVNGSVTLENGPVSMFGTIKPLTIGTAYTAPSDGFVTFHAYSGKGQFTMWDEGGNLLVQDSHFYSAAGADTAWFTMPVARGEHFRWTGSGSNMKYWWRSIGKNVGDPAVYNP